MDVNTQRTASDKEEATETMSQSFIEPFYTDQRSTLFLFWSTTVSSSPLDGASPLQARMISGYSPALYISLSVWFRVTPLLMLYWFFLCNEDHTDI